MENKEIKLVTVQVPEGSIIIPPDFEKMVAQYSALKQAAVDFCFKVESGKAKSTDSYSKFKAALELK